MRLNELTKRLLAEGYTLEDTPPGMRVYSQYDGGWTYTPEARQALTFETPCGLLVKGEYFSNGYLSFQGVDWRVENNNPTVCCPRFDLDFCPMRHPLLWSDRMISHDSEIIRQCACHQTERPYTYDGSFDEAHDKVWAEAEERWKVFEEQHKGRVCRHMSWYNRTTRTWHIRYDPLECAMDNAQCGHCTILNKDLDTLRGNVFYDVKATRTIKGDWLFPDKEACTIQKGLKVLDHGVSLTKCEAIVRYGKHHVISLYLLNHHHELFFDPTLRYELINFRAQRQNTRDIMQDLADTAAGIEVVHQADTDKLRKEQKRARKLARQERQIRKLEKVILADGVDHLDYSQRRIMGKYLTSERVLELLRLRESIQRESAEESGQLSLFDAA